MGNTNSSNPDLTTSPTKSRKNSLKQGIKTSGSAPSASGMKILKPLPISQVNRLNKDSPFVGSPLIGNNFKNNGSKSGRHLKEVPVLPESFPASLPERRFEEEVEEELVDKIDRVKLDKSSEGVPTLITWTSSAHNVYITGTFNGWKHKIPLNKSSDEFSTVIHFPLGIHHLKFIVDDEWKCSDDLLTATDHDGNLVNLIEVDESMLPSDLISTSECSELLSTSPPGEYSSDIPTFTNQTDRPPTLPPHLDKVILNAIPTDPTNDHHSLPVPNHVVLNHLYACSIRDGIMAVAGTTRYKKKYVTTIYYKPVVI